MTEKEISRKQRWRLGIIRHAEEVTHNVAKICRYFGISRTAFYKWYERYQNYGVEGLKDRSCRPLHSPHATNPEIIAKIIYLRQTYTLCFLFGCHQEFLLDNMRGGGRSAMKEILR